MKLSTIEAITGILAGMKICKITDKGVKSALVNNYIYLRRLLKDALDERAELVKKFKDDFREEFDEVARLRREGQPVVGHEAFLDAERDANRVIDGIFAREVEVAVKTIPLEGFIAACDKEELTLGQIAFLQENGIIEK